MLMFEEPDHFWFEVFTNIVDMISHEVVGVIVGYVV